MPCAAVLLTLHKPRTQRSNGPVTGEGILQHPIRAKVANVERMITDVGDHRMGMRPGFHFARNLRRHNAFVINPVAGDDIAVIGGGQQIAPALIGGDPRKAGLNRRHRQFLQITLWTGDAPADDCVRRRAQRPIEMFTIRAGRQRHNLFPGGRIAPPLQAAIRLAELIAGYRAGFGIRHINKGCRPQRGATQQRQKCQRRFQTDHRVTLISSVCVNAQQELR